MSDYAFAVFSLIGALLCFPAAYFNWKLADRPWSIYFFVAYVFLINILSFIDSIIWSAENIADWWEGYGYCDINIRIREAFTLGLPGAAIGICRFLAEACTPHPKPVKTIRRYEKLRRNIIDLVLGVIIPVTKLALNFIVESRRYSIVGVTGCAPVISTTWASILLFYIWTPAFSLVAAVFAGMQLWFTLILGIFIRNWYINRKILDEKYSHGMHVGISKCECRRLLFTVSAVIFIYFPISVYTLISAFINSRDRFVWADVHGPEWGIILKLSQPRAPWTAWVNFILSLTVFAFVGMPRNARSFYKRCFGWLYDRSPQGLKAKLYFLQNLSESASQSNIVTPLGVSTGQSGSRTLNGTGYCSPGAFLMTGTRRLGEH
jgi:pheromone a factor receptor